MKRIFSVLLTLASINAFAFPEAPFNALDIEIEHNEKSALQYDFEGIVKLSNCSGSLIRFAGQPTSSNAYVLTNGHCLGRPFLKPGEAVKNKKVRRRMKIADKNMKFRNVTAKLLVYGTMTGTDSAIYELNETYDQIAKMGIEPFDFDSTRPAIGVDIEIVSGYWERGYSCYIDGFVFNLREAGWDFFDSVRYSDKGCEVIGGTSGSPIIQKGTRVVVAINNTGNMNGRECTMNNPCEVDQDGNITVLKDRGYGQQTYNFYTCLTPDFRIDTSLPGCELTK
jgi:V8-like Glu-specific endopeptidase